MLRQKHASSQMQVSIVDDRCQSNTFDGAHAAGGWLSLVGLCVLYALVSWMRYH
ncbi:hypothetical protein DPMN_067911 [Dreissena polymorpha]|uniref:Uncharacterized protein n=1 Tax=Dreissena polymorpha TaxID=45954 RepID=A0A9D3Z0M2_DREPO|nr:hypothetical protein DPMN_067911 [Dreissena polymorpha]